MPGASSLRKKIVEFYLNRFAHRPALINPEWALSSDELRKIRIRWPEQYQWAAASDWVDVLLYGFRDLIRVEMTDDIPQDFKGTVVFQASVGGEFRNVAIGYSDYLPIDDDCARSSDLYFKMQFDENGYSPDHVVPGGYVTDGKRLYGHLNKLRRLRDQKQYAFDVNGRFGLDYSRELRQLAVDKLSSNSRFSFQGGMSSVSYSDFLKEITRSKICIDLPGLGPFCFRLMNYMAIGSCVIAYPHRARLHVPLVDRKHIVYCREDLSDLTDLCEYYLDHDDEREEIARNAREFFDLNLHKDNLVRYYLRTCLDRLS
jgi:hypothetical protein